MRTKLLASLTGIALAAAARAQTPVLGPEFVVHAKTAGQQLPPAVANLGSSGGFLVIWDSFTDNDEQDIIARRFSPTGIPLDDEFVVNAGPSSWKGWPRVASTPTGDFIVTWTEPPPGDELGLEVRARRFNASGTPLGEDILVNQYTTLDQAASALAVDPDGAFFVVWRDGGYYMNGQDGSGYGVFGRRFDADGEPLGDEFQINQYTTGDQEAPRIARKPNGDYIVVWMSIPFGPHAVMARLYDSTGTPLGGEFQVNSSGSFPRYTEVAVDGDGKAIVVWEDFYFAGPEGITNVDVRAQRLDASGNKLGPEFPVATDPTMLELRPTAAFGPDGGFLIAWMLGGPFAPRTVNALQFDATGRRLGDVVPVNTATLGFAQPALTAQPNGQFVLAWSADRTVGSEHDVEARVLGFPGVGPIRVDAPNATGPAAPSGSSNLNGVLEAGEMVAIEPAFRNPSNASLALTGTASNLQGPPGPVYTIVDGTADYGTIGAGANADCFQATGDCFQVSVTGARPAPHWDATFDEALSYNGFVRTAALHVGESFPDVPTDHPFYAFIENLFHNEVTAGCAGGGYCPGDDVTRAQMAVFLLKARYGSGFEPLPATGTVFTDVPQSDPFAPWIEELSREGITGGCGGGLYCPDSTVTRQQMAVFLLKTLEGSAYDPPDCTGVFGDVPCTPGTGFSDWIEQLYSRGITGGCSANPLSYCPTNPNNRGQMAVFLTKTFGLVLYGS